MEDCEMDIKSYLSQKGKAVKKAKDDFVDWFNDNRVSIGNTFIKAGATITTLAMLTGGLSGCAPLIQTNINNGVCPNCGYSYSAEKDPTGDTTIGGQHIQTPQAPSNVPITQIDGINPEIVLSAYDAVAGEMIRHYLIETNQISADANVEGHFVALSPTRVINDENSADEAMHYSFFFEDGNGNYPTTLLATADIDGQPLDKMFKFDNFLVGKNDMLAILQSNNVTTLVPHLLTSDEIMYTELANDSVAQGAVGTWIYPGMTFSRETIENSDVNHLSALFNATSSMTDNNLTYESYDHEANN